MAGRSLESKTPTAPGKDCPFARRALDRKGDVSRQQEQGEKKKADREGSPRAWEAGVPQVGNWQCPPSQRSGQSEGRRESLGTGAGQEGREGFTLPGL